MGFPVFFYLLTGDAEPMIFAGVCVIFILAIVAITFAVNWLVDNIFKRDD